MPNTTHPSPAHPSPVPTNHVHGELACADTEALLAEVTVENARLRAELDDLTRRLENAVAQKNLAIDEAVDARSRN